MTKVLLFAGFLFAGQYHVFGQTGKIALHHNGGVALYTNLNTALSGAVNGDTIYLPGGTVFVSTNPYINKSLTIVGAGHHPDSTQATSRTVIPVSIYIASGADNGKLTGIQCQTVFFGSTYSDQNVNNYILERCNIGDLFPSYDNNSTSQNIMITENIISYLHDYSYNTGIVGFSSALFEKNIFGPNSHYSKDALFVNNIFYCYYNYFNFQKGTYNNNIILCTANASTFSIGSTYTTFNNTLVCKLDTSALTVTYSGMYNNPINPESAVNTFVNAMTTDFSYSNNYHLKATSNGHNAGTDGTDVGIFGTQFPAKEGAVPFNPHISHKNIGTAVTPTGVLNVDVRVSAQDR